jgi:hypothetical protein
MPSRPSFEGCTEWTCIYHGAYVRAAYEAQCCGHPQLWFNRATETVVCHCGTDYGLITRER